MEQNQEFSARKSLEIINETLNSTRSAIVRKNGVSFIIWGCLLTFMSLLVYLLWKTTGSPSWNFLWFAMPVIGFPVNAMLRKKDPVPVPSNIISRLLGGTWSAFAVFALSVSAVSVVIMLTTNLPKVFAVANLTPAIILLFGLSETFSGIVLRNKVIAIGGFIIGVGGLAVYYLTGLPVEQMLIFTLAGVVLALTGMIIKIQNR